MVRVQQRYLLVLTMAKKVLVTRPKVQNQPLLAAIRGSGDIAIELPLLEIVPIAQAESRAEAIKTTILALNEFKHVIFISTNAATLALQWIDQYWPQLPSGQNWYGIGRATTEVLNQYKTEVIENSGAMNSEALLQLPELQHVSGEKILIFRGVGGRNYLKNELEKQGAIVSYCEVYERAAEYIEPATFERIVNEGLDFLTATSSETIQKLLDHAIISNIENQIRNIPIIVPGDRVAGFAKQSGFKHVVIAENAAVDSILKVMNTE